MSQIKVNTITNSAGTGAPSFSYGFMGVTDGSSAASGIVGEVISHLNSSFTTTTTGSYVQAATISLTAGDWDISALVTYDGQTGGTGADDIQIAVSTTTASSSGTTLGYSQAWGAMTPSFERGIACIPKMTVSISSTTSYYLNVYVWNGSGTHKLPCSLVARRMR